MTFLYKAYYDYAGSVEFSAYAQTHLKFQKI